MVLKFILILCVLANSSETVQFSNCKVSYGYAKVCQYYRFSELCVPWNLTNCEKLKRVQHDLKCPHYSCVSKNKEYNLNTLVPQNRAAGYRNLKITVSSYPAGFDNWPSLVLRYPAKKIGRISSLTR